MYKSISLSSRFFPNSLALRQIAYLSLCFAISLALLIPVRLRIFTVIPGQSRQGDLCLEYITVRLTKRVPTMPDTL